LRSTVAKLQLFVTRKLAPSGATLVPAVPQPATSGINAGVIYIMKYHIVKDAHILMIFTNSEQKKEIKTQNSKMIRWIRWKITMIGKADLMTNTAETKTA